MAIIITRYYTPTSGTITYAHLRAGYQQGIDSGYRGAGTMPSTLRNFASYYGVSTSGAISLRDFIGKSIITNTQESGGGGGGL